MVLTTTQNRYTYFLIKVIKKGEMKKPTLSSVVIKHHHEHDYGFACHPSFQQPLELERMKLLKLLMLILKPWCSWMIKISGDQFICAEDESHIVVMPLSIDVIWSC